MNEIQQLFNRVLGVEDKRYKAPDESSHYFEKFGQKKVNKKELIKEFIEKNKLK